MRFVIGRGLCNIISTHQSRFGCRSVILPDYVVGRAHKFKISYACDDFAPRRRRPPKTIYLFFYCSRARTALASQSVLCILHLSMIRLNDFWRCVSHAQTCIMYIPTFAVLLYIITCTYIICVFSNERGFRLLKLSHSDCSHYASSAHLSILDRFACTQAAALYILYFVYFNCTA